MQGACIYQIQDATRERASFDKVFPSFVVLGIKPRVSCILSKWSIHWTYSWPICHLSKVDIQCHHLGSSHEEAARTNHSLHDTIPSVSISLRCLVNWRGPTLFLTPCLEIIHSILNGYSYIVNMFTSKILLHINTTHGTVVHMVILIEGYVEYFLFISYDLPFIPFSVLLIPICFLVYIFISYEIYIYI